MEYNIFLETIKRKVQSNMGEAFDITITHVKKNNGICLDGIIINKKGQPVSPAIYLNDYYYAYREGKKVGDIVKEIVMLYYAGGPQPDISLEFFKTYQEMKSRVVYKLIHYHKNKEMLKEIPYMRFLDLAIVFYCDVSGEQLENGTILIYNDHLQTWGIELEELYQDAARNTPREHPAAIQTMEEVMKELFVHNLQNDSETSREAAQLLEQIFKEEAEGANHMKQPEGRYQMYVISNSDRLYGAAAVIYPQVLQKFADGLAVNLYLLPSSVHEMIVVPDDGNQDKNELLKMVSEINDTQVGPEEVLAYAIYYFERKGGQIILL